VSSLFYGIDTRFVPAEVIYRLAKKRVLPKLRDHRNGNDPTRLSSILWLELWFRVVTGELDSHTEVSGLLGP
jgi:hypothetical protein